MRNSKFNEVRNCSNCGEALKANGHFVPPSCGEDGFFICAGIKVLTSPAMPPDVVAFVQQQEDEIKTVAGITGLAIE